MGNGRWAGISSSLNRIRGFGAVLVLFLAGSVLLGLSSRRHIQQSLDELPPSPILSASLSSFHSKPDARAVLGQLPLVFEPNQGQAGAGVKFLARGAGYSLLLDATDAMLAVQAAPAGRGGPRQQFVRMKLVGANPAANIAGTNPLHGKSNYFIGNDPKRWHSGIPQFGGVRYESVYPGIDLVFYGNQGHLEYDFRVAPGADPSQAELQFDGASRLEMSGGDLLVAGKGAPQAAIRLHAPQIYQRAGDRRQPIDGRFVLRSDNRVSFEVGPYDRARELIIDPSLQFSSYFGGSGAETSPSVAVNGDGFIYIAGSTTSVPSTFPLNGTTPTELSTATNIFVAKISPSQPPAILYATFLGGNGTDTNVGLGVDGGGNTYIAGNTTSTNFPTTSLAYETKPSAKGAQCASPAPACQSLFVSVLSAPVGTSQAQALTYSSYLSGNGNDEATGMTIDTQQDVFITGSTTSNNPPANGVAFPATLLPVPFQSTSLSSVQFFATKVNTRVPGVGGVAYSTYFGGDTPAGAVADGGGIAVDTAGNMYFTGTTNFYNSGSGIYGNSGSSGDFPILNAYQPCLDTIPPVILSNPNACSPPTATPYPTDAFVAKINPLAQAGAQLLFSSYLGGTVSDSSSAITVDSGATNIYLTGTTNSPDFLFPTGTLAFQLCLDTPPVVPPAPPPCTVTSTPAAPAAFDAYVARMSNPSTSTTGTPNFVALTYFSYLGGSGNDSGAAIAVDTASDALITGTTNSTNFPVTVGAIQSTLNGTQNAFFAHINTTTVTNVNQVGSFATYFGGNGIDHGTSIAVDPSLNTYFAGDTTSTNLQVDDPLPGAGGSTLNGSSDAFVVKLGTATDLCIICVAPVISPTGTVSAGNQVTITYTLANEGPDVATGINVTGLVPTGVSFDSASVGSGTCSTPTGTSVVCQIPTLQAGSTSIVTFVVTPNSPGSYQATASVSNSNNTNSNTFATASFVAAGFSVAIAPSSQTIPAGQVGQYSVQVSPTQGVFGANVSLACSALPTGASCNFTTSTITLNGGAGSASSILNLSTTAQPVATASVTRRGPFYAFWLMVPGMALLGWGAGGKRRRGRLWGLIALSLFFALVLLQPACHSGTTQPTVSGTPSGTYSLTVTATSGSLTLTAPFNLTVIP